MNKTEEQTIENAAAQINDVIMNCIAKGHVLASASMANLFLQNKALEGEVAVKELTALKESLKSAETTIKGLEEKLNKKK